MTNFKYRISLVNVWESIRMLCLKSKTMDILEFFFLLIYLKIVFLFSLEALVINSLIILGGQFLLRKRLQNCPMCKL